MSYRVNYGNGQVSCDFETFDAATRHCFESNRDSDFARVQVYLGDGEWAWVTATGRPKNIQLY